MNKQFTIILLCLLTLAGCDSSQKPAQQADAINHVGQMKHDHTQGKRMQPLQMLLGQALVMAAYGANMKLDGNDQGQGLLVDATGLLRRAMSGPEMTMMHKGGGDMSASMHQIHDLGDTAFDLLGLMMGLSANDSNAVQLRKANELLAMAASGHNMLLQAESAGELGPVMQKHARELLNQAEAGLTEIEGLGEYHKLILHLLRMHGMKDHHRSAKI